MDSLLLQHFGTDMLSWKVSNKLDFTVCYISEDQKPAFDLTEPSWHSDLQAHEACIVPVSLCVWNCITASASNITYSSQHWGIHNNPDVFFFDTNGLYEIK